MILRPLPLTHRRNGVVVGTVALSMTSGTRYTRQLPDGSDSYIIQLARSPEFRRLLHKTRPAMPSDNHVKAAFRAMLKHSPLLFMFSLAFSLALRHGIGRQCFANVPAQQSGAPFSPSRARHHVFCR